MTSTTLQTKCFQKCDDARSLFQNLYREGRLEEARAFASDRLAEGADRLRWANSLAMIDRAEGNPRQALSTHLLTASVIDENTNPLDTADFHNGLALTYRKLSELENRPEYCDRALIEYEAARFHYEIAGNDRFLGGVENNIAFLLISMGRTEDAYPHLEEARKHFEKLHESARVAEIDDTLARAYLSDGALSEALLCATRAANSVAGTGERLVLKDCLTTLSQVIEAFDREFDREQVREALKESNGSIPRAAKLLAPIYKKKYPHRKDGLTRQGLKDILDNKFPELESLTVRRGK